jgi:protein tyrosine phosphatase
MNGIDIRKMILDMRKHRMGLIQTADQLRFSYLAIIEGGKRILNKEQLSTMDVLSSYIVPR